MLIRANSNYNFMTRENTKFNISKDEFIYVEYDDKSDIMYIDNHSMYISYEHFKSLFSLVEEHKILHMKRFINDSDISFEEQINKFICDDNIKINNIFEPNSSTVDIYYTKYIGDWE